MSIESLAEAVVDREDTLSIRPVDFVGLAGKVPPTRKWVVNDWIPRGALTLLVGKGGVGKSLLAQQLGTSIAAAKDWLGPVPRSGAVVGLFCEDDHDELWRRQVDICRSLNVPMDGVGQWLSYDARAGRTNGLTFVDPRGGVLRSPLVEEVRRVLSETGDVQLLILDNVGQMFVAGDNGENDKAKVTMFCNMLTGLALEFDIGILLLAHPAKADGSEWSGNVAWDAAVRTRLFLTRETEEPNSRIILQRPKANYASRDGQVAFVWERGAFLRADGRQSPGDAMAAASRASEAQRTVLDALQWLADRKLTASHKSRSGNYLPKQMKSRGLAGGFSVHELSEAMDSLIADMRIEVDASLWRDAHRNPVTGLKATGTRAAESQTVSKGVPLYKGDTPLDSLHVGSEPLDTCLSTGTQTDRHDLEGTP